MSVWGRRFFSASGIIILLLLWHWGSSRPGWNHFLFPAPSAVLARMVQLVRNGMLARHLLASLSRVFSGFAISVAVAFPLGIALALLPVFSLPARPVLNFVRQIPPLAVIPLLILGLGIGEASRIAVVVMASFFPILLNAENGIRHVDSKLIEVGKTLSLPRSATFRYIAFPAFFPHFFVGVRLALSYSWRSLVGAEIVAASSGLGYMIREAETLSRSDTIICGVLVLGCVGALSDLLLEALSSRLFPWSQAS
ncbi:MAG: ABC transporter permease [Synergistaceae bacterium]|nr:ABC transporter permease [Synergistaceae bacterium]